jgi:23S rRNA G2445 N2-methylase RlmL
VSVTYDDKSPPGAWKEEMKAAPWGYGQTQQQQIERALQNIRRAGLSDEATVITLELNTFKTEVELLRGNRR